MNSGGMAGGGMQSGGATVGANAAGTLMLFRYLDFDVNPGEAYRYRVKLEFANPNYLVSTDQVKEASVAENETRTTAWSEPSAPVVVKADTNTFLADIEPGSPYLTGATGPLAGARLLFGDPATRPSTINGWLTELGNELAVPMPMQILEDSLCNWQKNPDQFVPFRG